MKDNTNILEIMEHAIDSLKDHKGNVMTIIQNLQADYAQKKYELEEIKKKLPELLLETAKLRTLDKQLRQKLMDASHDFSNLGHQKIQNLFEQASTMHTELYKAEENEQACVSRRNKLEIELKKLKTNIELAENMVQQLIVSLSYLQVGINDLHKKPSSHSEVNRSPSHDVTLTAFKCIEDEKSRIARDLHDGPMQRIASVQMRIDFCKTAMSIDLEKGLDLLDHLKQDLTYTLSEVRDILFDLNPAPLEKLGLKPCIDHLLYHASDKLQIDIHFNYQLEDCPLSLSIQNSIYRIVQELINNVKKHAKAQTLHLRIQAANDFIYIIMEDDGVGFEVPKDFELMCTQNKSYGLFNIYTRVNQLDGVLKINSAKNKGSCFKIQLPLLSS